MKYNKTWILPKAFTVQILVSFWFLYSQSNHSTYPIQRIAENHSCHDHARHYPSPTCSSGLNQREKKLHTVSVPVAFTVQTLISPDSSTPSRIPPRLLDPRIAENYSCHHHDIIPARPVLAASISVRKKITRCQCAGGWPPPVCSQLIGTNNPIPASYLSLSFLPFTLRGYPWFNRWNHQQLDRPTIPGGVARGGTKISRWPEPADPAFSSAGPYHGNVESSARGPGGRAQLKITPTWHYYWPLIHSSRH